MFTDFAKTMMMRKTCIAVSILVLGLLCNTPDIFGQAEEKPNILIIMTDQQAWDAVAYSGNKAIITPNLDRLASQGVNFSHAVTPCPVCVPARTSVLTGRLTETTTIRDNRDAKPGIVITPLLMRSW